MAKYRPKPVEVQAEQFLPGQSVPADLSYMWGGYYLVADSGSIPVNPTDWVVTYVSGYREIVADEDFIRDFEPVREDPVGNVQ